MIKLIVSFVILVQRLSNAFNDLSPHFLASRIRKTRGLSGIIRATEGRLYSDNDEFYERNKRRITKNEMDWMERNNLILEELFCPSTRDTDNNNLISLGLIGQVSVATYAEVTLFRCNDSKFY